MFNALSGTIAGKKFDTLFLDQNGIEWEISVPAISIDEFGRIGTKTRVLTWLQHREDQMKLFGFPDEATRTFFLELIKVDGIGPKQAMKILSGIPIDELAIALENEDLAGIEKAPGVGRKTAQKIIDMGYDSKKAHECVARLVKEIDSQKKGLSPEEREKELFKRAIVALSGER
jgi:Holliday junction DNA helicase RuvA